MAYDLLRHMVSDLKTCPRMDAGPCPPNRGKGCEGGRDHEDESDGENEGL